MKEKFVMVTDHTEHRLLLAENSFHDQINIPILVETIGEIDIISVQLNIAF